MLRFSKAEIAEDWSNPAFGPRCGWTARLVIVMIQHDAVGSLAEAAVASCAHHNFDALRLYRAMENGSKK